MPDVDPTAVERKKDHIELAFKSQVTSGDLDKRFFYEPMLAAHPQAGGLPPLSFLGKTLRTPVWVSSMTGGTTLAATINRNLARACGEFGMGMGLGSCRALLYGNEHLSDFDVRAELGAGLPLFANLGIAQVEQLLDRKETDRIDQLLYKLQADGLIIHVNPMQEWLQPEGDRFSRSPLEVILQLLDSATYPLIVKEVGQGMGPESLKALMQLPLAAIEFAAGGGTNFAKLELMRSSPEQHDLYRALSQIGHRAADMVNWTNGLLQELGDKAQCRQFIISGGIPHFLEGYYLIRKLQASGVYGQASAFLKHAREDYQQLQTYVDAQVRGLELANAYLRVK